MSISKKITIMQLTLVILVFFVVLVNYMTYISLENDAPFINLSGSERMRSFKMALLAEQIKTSDNAAFTTLLTEEVQKFESILNGLILGDATMKLKPITDTNIKSQLLTVQKEWETIFKPGYEAILKNKDPKQMQVIVTNIFTFVDEINKIVFDYDKLSQKKVSSSKIMSIILLLISIGVMIACFIITKKVIIKPLNTIVKSLNISAEETASASNELSGASNMLAESSSKQAAAVVQTAAALEESTSMVTQNTENTREAATLSEQARISAERGNIDMATMVESMQEIKTSSDEISKIIKVIDEIAFHTNILALNAAVEAARAGEAGLGFAVVAEEVRNLSHRTALAAKETTGIIQNNIDLSANGVNVTKKVEESLSEITILSNKVNQLMKDISQASFEQSTGIKQINIALSSVEDSTTSISATSQESAATSDVLSGQADTLKEIVVDLVTLVEGKSK